MLTHEHIESNFQFNNIKSRNSLEEIPTYQVGGKTFIVTPIFKESGRETLGAILMKLMKADS